MRLVKGFAETAAQVRETIVVENVHEFPGHIACDSDSNSEIVVPLIKDGQLIGVLDLDSAILKGFDDEDAKGLNDLARILIDSSSLEYNL